MELLTPSGWRPTNDIESVIIQIRAEIIEGGARIEFRQDFPYTEVSVLVPIIAWEDLTFLLTAALRSAIRSIQDEARAAFHRVANQHGWM